MSVPSATVSSHDYRSDGARLIADLLVDAGAVMVMAGPVFSIQVVGHVAWLGKDRLLWCVAGSSVGRGMHVLHYDGLCRVAHRCVAFFYQEDIVAYLCSIEAPGMGGLRHLRALHRAWRRRSVQPAVCAACDRFHPAGEPRRCHWRLCGPDGSRPGDTTSVTSPARDSDLTPSWLPDRDRFPNHGDAHLVPAACLGKIR